MERPNNSSVPTNDSNFISEFTFHKNMYKAAQKSEHDLHDKGFEGSDSFKIRRVDQEYPQHYEKIRNIAHPKVNLPVFRKNRNEKIKVFSVKSKDRKQKWTHIQK